MHPAMFHIGGSCHVIDDIRRAERRRRRRRRKRGGEEKEETEEEEEEVPQWAVELLPYVARRNPLEYYHSALLSVEELEQVCLVSFVFFCAFGYLHVEELEQVCILWQGSSVCMPG